MKEPAFVWHQEDYCLRLSVANDPSVEVPETAARLYERTCRTSFEAPGFCLLHCGDHLDSHGLREMMVRLKMAMSAIHEKKIGKSLAILSAARFDQQISTKPHLDGGPEECFLMLGYEPTQVESELEIIDYTRCAFDLGLTPDEFMSKHNPMFVSNTPMLGPYTTRLSAFRSMDFQILCVNNSRISFNPSHHAWQGTLHSATIPRPDESQRRVINSMMIASVEIGEREPVDLDNQREFIDTTLVRRSGYDKPHLADDV